MIEAEIRSFLTKEQFGQLILKYKDKLSEEDFQETYYFNAPEDLRIQRNNSYSKVWLKKGKIHEEGREEIEIRLPREDFKKLEILFLSLGYNVAIKWFRKRREFSEDGITVSLDDTTGYGYIIELEKMCEESEKDAAIAELKQKLADIGILLTPKEDFDKRFNYYKENWKELTKGEKND